ncbi:MAG TPA: hypothetical protein DGP39_04885, partial [Verrucomicrobiales bacterium]|nr:hypothetical protein [Verrucomicrobiales bacterium]
MNLPPAIQVLFDTPSLPGLGPERRDEALSLNACHRQIEQALKSLDATPQANQLLSSAALLWHDHLDPSHTISQDIHDADGSLLHGIMHRREPDYPNAKYWFNRTGPHSVFEGLPERCQSFLTETSLRGLAEGNWDAIEMVDAVSRTSKNTTDYTLLQRVQAEEITALLE